MKRWREIEPNLILIADPGCPEVIEVRRRPGGWRVKAKGFQDRVERDPERAVAVGHGRIEAVMGR